MHDGLEARIHRIARQTVANTVEAIPQRNIHLVDYRAIRKHQILGHLWLIKNLREILSLFSTAERSHAHVGFGQRDVHVLLPRRLGYTGSKRHFPRNFGYAAGRPVISANERHDVVGKVGKREDRLSRSICHGMKWVAHRQVQIIRPGRNARCRRARLIAPIKQLIVLGFGRSGSATITTRALAATRTPTLGTKRRGWKPARIARTQEFISQRMLTRLVAKREHVVDHIFEHKAAMRNEGRTFLHDNTRMHGSQIGFKA